MDPNITFVNLGDSVFHYFKNWIKCLHQVATLQILVSHNNIQMKRSVVITCHTNDVYLALISFLFFPTKFCCIPNKTQLMVPYSYLCQCFLSWFLFLFFWQESWLLLLCKTISYSNHQYIHNNLL
ncbi:Os08g0563450 [Oryza sativa Japonica Group]|uniref:Os08g0563450 protein n=1 Tax=Oryza sativa subsp. japonica TaxID=39947 RepID=A0A0N7KQB2_ORYSJ|nr:hypothetical protein EE612_045968 [Oryza sativa]BAT06730.1 Os08g0563450 [Oryza sativa Japonica Group]